MKNFDFFEQESKNFKNMSDIRKNFSDLCKYAPKIKFEFKFKFFENLKKIDLKFFFWKFSEKITEKFLKTLKIFIFIPIKIFDL